MADALPAATREWFSTPGPFTGLGDHRFDLALDTAGKPAIVDVVRAVQGLVIYDLVASPFYDIQLTPEQAATVNVRSMTTLLDHACAIDPRPLTEPRTPDRRVAGRCRTFATLTVALLRAHGVPARARCGFGAYFRPGYFEDHWIAEYWSDAEARWVMVDAQLDDAWTHAIGFTGNPLDLTPDEFVVAGPAWTAWRRGTADPDRYGLSAIEEHGAFWIAGNLRLDLTALNKVEMQPWDVWGAHWEPADPIPTDLTLFDRMADATQQVDHDLDALRTLSTHPEIRMPGEVWNVMHQATEVVTV